VFNPSVSYSRFFLCCLLVVAVFLQSSVQILADTQSDFETRRSAFTQAVSAATLPTLRQQASSLLALERSAAAAKNYDAAIAIREERKRVDGQIATIEKLQLLSSAQQQTSQLLGNVNLRLEDATLTQVSLESGTLSHWSTGASASWKLPSLPPGGYEVVLKYESSATEGGSLLVSEAVFTLKGNLGTTLKGATELNLGTLRITDGTGSLILKAASVVGENLMRLHSITLIPAAQGTSP
jgi:hypothetical protein